MVSRFTHLGLSVSPPEVLPVHLANPVRRSQVAVLVPLQLILITDMNGERDLHHSSPDGLWLGGGFLRFLNCSGFGNGEVTKMTPRFSGRFQSFGGCHE
jgi:hypothetical protein